MRELNLVLLDLLPFIITTSQSGTKRQDDIIGSPSLPDVETGSTGTGTAAATRTAEQLAPRLLAVLLLGYCLSLAASSAAAHLERAALCRAGACPGGARARHPDAPPGGRPGLVSPLHGAAASLALRGALLGVALCPGDERGGEDEDEDEEEEEKEEEEEEEEEEKEEEEEEEEEEEK